MVQYVFANAPATPVTLAGGGIDSSVTTIVVAAGRGADLPAPGASELAILRIENEYVTYTTRSTDTLTGVTRGFSGSTAASHAAGVEIRNVATKEVFALIGTGGLYSAYIQIEDQKAQNTSGGTFTSGGWRTRDQNTEVVDSGGHASVASNQITLAAGTYDYRIEAPGYFVGRHMARLQNITDATTVRTGRSTFSNAAVPSLAIIEGRVTIAGTKTFEVQHRCETTEATYGFGVETNLGDEVYTVAKFWKVS